MLKKIRFPLILFSFLFFTQCGVVEKKYRSPYEACEELMGKQNASTAPSPQDEKDLKPQAKKTISAIALYKSETCILPNNVSLKIACTYSCSERHKKILKKIADKLKYKIEFIGLNSDESLKGYNTADAIILEGGADLNYHLYESKYGKKGLSPELLKTINRDLDEDLKLQSKNKDLFELEFLRTYFKNEQFIRVPIMGIGRGMHLLAVLNGLPLYADVNIQAKIENPTGSIEEIDLINKDSDLWKILENEKLEALENYHQAIDIDYYKKSPEEISYPFNIVANSNEGKIIEAIEFKERKVLGTQFYPELSSPSIKEKIYSWFLVKTCQGKWEVLPKNGEVNP